jgi:hypothetical protein
MEFSTSSSRKVLLAKALTLFVLSACAIVLGFFVLMAESGGKDSRPDIVLPLVLAIVVILGVRRGTQRPVVVILLMAGSAVLGASPLLLSFHDWTTDFTIPWWLTLVLATGAAWLSRGGASSSARTRSQ